MPTAGGPNTLGESNLVFAYDTGDVSNSYRGQPTTNIGNNFRDFTGTGYSPDGEWVSSPTRFTKTYYPNLTTPIGPGGTLIEESGTGGYHHLSRYGGGSESGAHSLSCYIYPLVSGITDFCIGMLGDSSNNIRFNLDTRVITYGGGISNTNAFIRDIPGWPGWLRVGANIEGRGGGWVGCFGYTSYTTYTGTAGGKKAYITGIQYEYTTQPTSFVAGTRSATQGLLPLIGNSTIDLTNVSFDSSAKMVFDGTNDGINLESSFFTGTENNVTFECIVKLSANQTSRIFLSNYTQASSATGLGIGISDSTTNKVKWFTGNLGTTNTLTSNTTLSNGAYYHVVGTYNGSSKILYINGTSEASATITNGINITSAVASVGYLRYLNNQYLNGEVPVAKIYNRALTAQEVKQNYQQYKTRFNLS